MDELQHIEQRLQEVEALNSGESRHLADCLKRIATSSFDHSTTFWSAKAPLGTAAPRETPPERLTMGGQANGARTTALTTGRAVCNPHNCETHR